MMFNGPWQLTAAQDALKDDLGVALVPKFFGDGDWAGSHTLHITPSAAGNADKKAAAYFFMDWFINHSLDWAGAGQVPALNDVRAQLEGKTEGVLPYITQIAPLAESVKFLPTIPGGGDLLFVANGAGDQRERPEAGPRQGRTGQHRGAQAEQGALRLLGHSATPATRLALVPGRV